MGESMSKSRLEIALQPNLLDEKTSHCWLVVTCQSSERGCPIERDSGDE